MSIATNLQKLETDITNAYDAVQTKGGTLPTDKNTNNLVTAISSIPSGGGDIDWSEIGYSGTPQAIIDGFNYAKQISDNWDSSRTNYNYYFQSNTNLIYMPLVDTSNGTDFGGMFYSCVSLQVIPQINTSNGTTFGSMFSSCVSLQEVPQLDTSNGTSFGSMFSSCTALKTIPLIDTSSGTDFGNMFGSCKSLQTIPQLDTSNGTNFQQMFSSCVSLQEVPQLDTSNGQAFNYMFSSASSIITIPELNFQSANSISGMISSTNLTNLGGFLNLGQAYLTTQSANSYSYTLNLNQSNNLTHDSLMNVINKLYDIAAKGCNTQKLVLGSTNLAKLTAEEIAIATNKGWSVS